MQIIKEGTVPPPAPEAWWIGVELTCGHCGTVVKLEAGDPVTGTAERRPHGARTVDFKCPKCQSDIHRVFSGPEFAALSPETKAAPTTEPAPDQPAE